MKSSLCLRKSQNYWKDYHMYIHDTTPQMTLVIIHNLEEENESSILSYFPRSQRKSLDSNPHLTVCKA